MPETTAATGKPVTQTNGPESTRGGAYYTPRVDICESDDELVLACDMPGVQPADIDLRFENGELILIGKVASRQPKEQLLLNEYGVGDYYRSFSINEVIDASKISADYKHGVLTMHLPKKEAARPRRITVMSE
jgi:HSP20 family protein